MWIPGSFVSFTNNEGPAVNLLYGMASCLPGLPTNYFPSCTTACYQQWKQPDRTTTCSPELGTLSPTRVPTVAPTAITAPPTWAPTVTPAFTTCTYGSPLSSVFARIGNTITVSNQVELLSALAAVGNQPTIIVLTNTTVYTLDKVYNINTNVCIQVR